MNTYDEGTDVGWNSEKTEGASRGRAREAENSGERVSVSKTTREDGAEVTRVSYPPRQPLRSAGQIKAAYESGDIDLETLIENAKSGLEAMQHVIITDSQGTGKDRVTTQRVELVPDHPMRLRWQEYLTNVVEGMPVKRQEIVSKKLTTKEDLMNMLRKSKAARKSMRSLLDRLEEEIHSNKGGN